jgi:hypothetical protein
MQVVGMKNKILAILFGVVGLIVVVACLYAGVTYLGFIGKALIEFFSPGNISAMNGCGIATPQEFIDIRNQLPTTLLPAIYIGIPLSLIIISVLMFFSGYFFGKHNFEQAIGDKEKRKKEVDEEVSRRVGKHFEGRAPPKPAKKAEVEEEPEEAEEEETPAPKRTARK